MKTKSIVIYGILAIVVFFIAVTGIKIGTTYGNIKNLAFVKNDRKIQPLKLCFLPHLAPFAKAGKSTTNPLITLIGHASLKVKTTSGKVMYIDPSYTGDYSEPADFILITHSHDDHNKPNKCTKSPSCVIIRWYDALIDGEYKSFDYDDIHIQAVPSGGNMNHKLVNNVGYLVTVDGKTIYHAGDTSFDEATKSIANTKIDYAFYPVDGTFTMKTDEATQMADFINARHSIPFHTDINDVLEQQIAFNPHNKLLVLYGQTFEAK